MTNALRIIEAFRLADCAGNYHNANLVSKTPINRIAFAPMDNENIARGLRALIGNVAVISTPEELLVYECDAYTLEKFLPNVVVLPRTTEQVVATVKFCAQH